MDTRPGPAGHLTSDPSGAGEGNSYLSQTDERGDDVDPGEIVVGSHLQSAQPDACLVCSSLFYWLLQAVPALHGVSPVSDEFRSVETVPLWTPSAEQALLLGVVEGLVDDQRRPAAPAGRARSSWGARRRGLGDGARWDGSYPGALELDRRLTAGCAVRRDGTTTARSVIAKDRTGRFGGGYGADILAGVPGPCAPRIERTRHQ